MAMNMDAMLRIKADVQGENNIRRLGNSMQGLQGQVKNAALGFNSFKGAVAGVGAAIAGSAIVGGLTAVVKRSIDAGDELFNLQAKTGLAANALIGIGNAAKLADVDMATLGKGLTKLNVNLVKAAEGNEDLARKFQALGVQVKDSNGQVVPADKALKQIADRFADMPDGAQKAAAAVALFGKSGADLIPLLNEGAASMEKFTYKVSEDFAARSDLFNDTITEFGIKTQGFGMELTDALLPALQSILEVFGDLFDTQNDWSALFEVIKVGLRTVATVLYATIKLVDQFVKAIVYSFDAIGKALAGDFAAAGQALSDGFGAGLEQAKRDFEQIQKLWMDAPSPGTGRRTSGRSMALDTTDADTRAVAAARRAASEQERIEERRRSLSERALELQERLRRSVEDVNQAYKGVGATPVEQLFLQRNEAIADNNRTVDELTKDVVKLALEVNQAGGQIDIRPFEQLVNALSDANKALADKQLQQGLKELLPSLEDYDAKIKEIQQGKAELSEVEKLNAQVNLLQLDILAQTNPALAEHIRLLRERAKALDDATAKQKKDSESIGTGIRDRLQEYYNSVKDLGGAIGNAVVSGLQGLEDQLTAFVTTGKANFKELAASILSDLARIALRAAIIQPIVQALGGLFPGFKFANGGIMTGDGPMPLKKYANGGIASTPQLALFGEGSKPEAFVPLPDGRRIPVAMQGGGSSSNTNVTVNVDAKNTSVQGDSGRGEQLARVVAQAVQAELIKQKRPGGLLVT
jgi:lambda family phage tail tape measure protein